MSAPGRRERCEAWLREIGLYEPFPTHGPDGEPNEPRGVTDSWALARFVESEVARDNAALRGLLRRWNQHYTKCEKSSPALSKETDAALGGGR